MHVFDSKSGCAGETLVTVKVGEFVRQNLSKEAIIEHANQFIDSMKTYFVLENYGNLQKNGRMGKVTGKLISILGIRLVMGTDDGEIILCHKTRGENTMLEKMVGLVGESGRPTEGEMMVISHCNNPGLARRLADAVKQRFDFSHIHIVPTGGLSSMYADNKGVVMAF